MFTLYAFFSLLNSSLNFISCYVSIYYIEIIIIIIITSKRVCWMKIYIMFIFVKHNKFSLCLRHKLRSVRTIYLVVDITPLYYYVFTYQYSSCILILYICILYYGLENFLPRCSSSVSSTRFTAIKLFFILRS